MASRSGFKIPDQVQEQGVKPIRRRPPTIVGLWRDKSRKRSPANGGMSKYIYRRLVMHLSVIESMQIPP
jgi:hypothetical protein